MSDLILVEQPDHTFSDEVLWSMMLQWLDLTQIEAYHSTLKDVAKAHLRESLASSPAAWAFELTKEVMQHKEFVVPLWDVERSHHERHMLLQHHKPFMIEMMRRLLGQHSKLERHAPFVRKTPEELVDVRCAQGDFVCGRVYKPHPLDTTLYYPVAPYHRLIKQSKVAEFIDLVTALGAKRVTLSQGAHQARQGGLHAHVKEPTHAADVGVKAHASHKSSKAFSIHYTSDRLTCEPHRTEGLVWTPTEPLWESMIKARLGRGCTSYTVEFSYTQNFDLDVTVAAMLQDVGVSLGGTYEEQEASQERYEVEFWS